MQKRLHDDDLLSVSLVQPGRKEKQRSYSPKETFASELQGQSLVNSSASCKQDQLISPVEPGAFDANCGSCGSDSMEEESVAMGSINTEKRRRRKKKNQKEHDNAKAFKDKVFGTLVNKQMTSFINSLSIETNNLYESKILCFERIRVFIQNIFPMAQPVLFGSNAVGLSLPSSDIDIMLVNVPCRTKDEANECLAQIAILINAMSWVVSCSTYLGAKVPLVKLEIDPSISYF